MQNENGDFLAYDEESCESISQVIVALTGLGIDREDERFVKNGNTLESRLFVFLTEEGGFSHVPGGSADAMATEQAFYTLVAMERAGIRKRICQQSWHEFCDRSREEDLNGRCV